VDLGGAGELWLRWRQGLPQSATTSAPARTGGGQENEAHRLGDSAFDGITLQPETRHEHHHGQEACVQGARRGQGAAPGPAHAGPACEQPPFRNPTLYRSPKRVDELNRTVEGNKPMPGVRHLSRRDQRANVRDRDPCGSRNLLNGEDLRLRRTQKGHGSWWKARGKRLADRSPGT
jgi:hypothetical protein